MFKELRVALLFHDFVVFTTQGKVIHSTGQMTREAKSYQGHPLREVLTKNRFGPREEFIEWYHKNINNLKE